MNTKLLRSEYYEDDFYFNEQEYKEFNFSRIDPYWKVRGCCYSLSLNCLGDKETLTKRLDYLLFNNYLHKKPSIENVQEVADTELEVVMNNLKCTSGQFDDVTQQKLQAQLKEDNIDKNQFSHQYPWQIVVEMSKMNRRLTYLDCYKGMTSLMRSNMVFYNHFIDNDSLTAIITLPYTPKMLDYLNPLQIYSLVKALRMKTNYDQIKNVMDVYRQALMDIFYAVDDTQRLHGVVPCLSQFKSCNNMASQFCCNYMCKKCCQDNQHRKACQIHDNYEQFFRQKIQSLYNFEQQRNFNRKKTLRLHFRKLIRRYDLEKVFENTGVEWEKVKLNTFFHPQIYRLQYIYLTFASEEQAQKVFTNKHHYELKLEKYDLCIQPLNRSLYNIADKMENPDLILVVIKPLTTLEVIQDIPQGEQYINQLTQLISTITQLDISQFGIEEDILDINGQPNTQHLFITMPDKESLDKLYNAQPFFGCLVAHKLTHIQICPFIRPHAEQCMMCVSFKDKTCVNDMCKDCCSRQKYSIIKCSCSAELTATIKKARQEQIDNSMTEEEFCQICNNKMDVNCPNKLCEICCPIQAVRTECVLHDESCYCKNLKKIDPNQFGRRILQIIAETQLKVRYDIKQGRYDWFRPVYGTNLAESMIKANKELQEVVDNGGLVRGQAATKYKREGKIFTFQANQPVSTWISPTEKLYENIDLKGNPYIEYNFGEEISKQDQIVWVKNNSHKYRTYGVEEYQNYIRQPYLQTKNSFHLFLIGLDKHSYSIKELYQEIFTKVKQNVGEIQQKNIMIIDNESILCDVFSSPHFLKNNDLNENLTKLGRIALIKLENILDALALFVKSVKLTLPLSSGVTDEPTILPSSNLLRFIEEFNPNTANVNILAAGNAFNKLNKEIETTNAEIKKVMNFSSHGGPKNGGSGGFRGRNFKRGGGGGRRPFRGGRGKK